MLPDMSITEDEGERSRIRFASSGPRIPGITTSVRTRSKPPASPMISSARSGSGTVVVAYPALSRMLATTCNTWGSSSTTRIFALATSCPFRDTGIRTVLG